jgi:DNA-binding transcriptional ArsR family regulator
LPKKTKERIEDVGEKLDAIMNRLDQIEAVLSSGKPDDDLLAILRGLRASVSLYNQPVQALKRLYDAQPILKQETVEKDEISRIVVEALAVHGSMNASQLTREVHKVRGKSSRRIVRERLKKLQQAGLVRLAQGPGRRYELVK